LSEVLRWRRNDRVSHLLLVTGVVLATVTGLPLFDNGLFWPLGYAFDFGLPASFMGLLGVTLRGLLHRVGAIIIVGAILIHLWSRRGRWKTEVLMNKEDVKALLTLAKYNLRLTRDYPSIGFHHPGEKAVYLLAGVVGISGLSVSGLILWFPSLAPGYQSAALLVHDLAFATVAVIIAGHFLLALNPANRAVLKAMFGDGKVPLDWARGHHPGWKVEAGVDQEGTNQPVRN
jgi:formate dehydrogenase subunit gamma